MASAEPSVIAGVALDPAPVAAWLGHQRWSASKSRSIADLKLQVAGELGGQPPLAVVLARTDASTGAADLYQLPLVVLPAGSTDPSAVVEETADGRWLVDALAEPEHARPLLSAMADEVAVDGEAGTLHFHHVAKSGPLPLEAPARPIGVEQSNSSIVFGETVVLKTLRRVEAGINPELEMLRFLSAHGFAQIAPLRGWYELEGRSATATLGVAQQFLPDATGGWELALELIGSDPSALVAELGVLGRVTAAMHNALATDPDDPAFAPLAVDAEAPARLAAEIDGEVERLFARLGGDPRVAAISGCGAELRALIARRAQGGAGGRAIRIHGDYHLGQTLFTHGGASTSVGAGAPSGEGADPRGWVLIDFEGEPARPLEERRRRTSPLRDVAGMLRSFAYAARAVAILCDQPAPPAFEAQAREAFLTGYLTTVDPTLLPSGETAIADLLALHELQKVVYELGYELDHRPDWLPIPVAGITDLLERP